MYPAYPYFHFGFRIVLDVNNPDTGLEIRAKVVIDGEHDEATSFDQLM